MFRRISPLITPLLLTLFFAGISVCHTYGNGSATEQPDRQEEIVSDLDSLSNRELYQRSSISVLSSQLVEERASNENLRQAIRDRDSQLQLDGKKQARAYHFSIISLAILLLSAILLHLFHRHSLKSTFRNLMQQNQMEQERLLTVERVRVRMEALEEERERISRNLHDSISNNLVSIGLRLRTIADDQPQKRELLQLVEGTHREIRAIMHNLSSPSLDTMPFEQLFHYHIELMSSRAELRVEGILLPENGWSELNRKLQTELFRLVQEVTGNIVKHSRATRVTITLRRDQEATTLIAEDDGIGMPSSQTSVGFGMKNLKTRVEYLGGEIQVSSQPMNGTVVRICIPKITAYDKTLPLREKCNIPL